MKTNEPSPFDNSIVSVICVVFAVGIPTSLMSGHRGSGNLEIFPPNLLLMLACSVGFGIAGLVFGYRGLVEGRRPIIALIGFGLSLLIFIWPFIPHH